MRLNFKPKSEYEKFGQKIYDLLVENSAATFYVAGMVRDLLLKKKFTDIDIATALTPDEVISIMQKNGLAVNTSAKQFGTITVTNGKHMVEVTTMRKEAYDGSRYPKVSFVNSPSADSRRRDFTMNALYLSQKNGSILDFYDGVSDINNKIIRFIGDPAKRIAEDPLRIIRALRFALTLNFTLEKNTLEAIKDNYNEINKLTKSRIDTELKKFSNKRPGGEIFLLDKYFNRH